MVTKSDILARLAEFDAIGEIAFLEKYANGYGSRTTWIKHEGVEYPIKAIWAAAHKPPMPPTSFTTHDAKRPLKKMKFEIVERDTSDSIIGQSVAPLRGLPFSTFCQSLGFPLKNVRWSWCAFGEKGGQSLFTVWDNEIKQDGQTYEFWDGDSDELRTDNGAREFKRILTETLDKGLVAYGVKCTPVYPLTIPRKRQTFDQESLLALRMRREGNKILGQIIGTASCDAIRTGFTSDGSAIDDLDSTVIGNLQPGRTAYTGTFIVRDERVRQAVIKRANGRCEHCGQLGFMKADGTHYVEAHHIISLAKQGPDALENVIALCPNHHREAHFGEEWERLEAELKAKLIKLRSN